MATRHGTILVVDDEEVMRDILETLLTREGYDVRLASSGEDQVTVFTRDSDPHRPELSVRVTVDGLVRAVRVNNTFQACHSFEESYANPAVERIAAELLN